MDVETLLLPVKVLLVADSPVERSTIGLAIESAAGEVKCASTVGEVLLALRHEHFDVIIVDRHLGGWLGAQACKALRAKTAPIPVAGLINEECVLDLRDGIESGLTGVYYKDQIDAYLLRRLAQLAHLDRSRRSERRSSRWGNCIERRTS